VIGRPRSKLTVHHLDLIVTCADADACLPVGTCLHISVTIVTSLFFTNKNIIFVITVSWSLASLRDCHNFPFFARKRSISITSAFLYKGICLVLPIRIPQFRRQPHGASFRLGSVTPDPTCSPYTLQ
jgi:hypothetical protein